MANFKKLNISARLNLFFSSNVFFYLILFFMGFSALWVALTSLYPMAFDEDFHFGLIKIYAESWSLFSVVQKESHDVYGSIVTDPSYLFHYLMSFPYRLLDTFINNETTIIILLRIINIALFLASIVVFRKVLLKAKVSPALTHITLALFILIPVVPLLAGQINYDNLLILLFAYSILLTLQIRENLIENNKIPAVKIMLLANLMLLASLVKYAFLPIALAIGGYVLYLIYKDFRRNGGTLKNLSISFSRLSTTTLLFFGMLSLVSIILFSQRYILNLIQYNDVVPDCAVVLNEERCSSYGPWARDYKLEKNKNGREPKGPLEYTTQEWVQGMWQRLFFSLAGPTNGHQTRLPLQIPSNTAAVLTAVSIILLIVYGVRISKRYPAFVIFTLVTVVYVVLLWFQQYQSQVRTAEAVAVNGRYLLPFLPLIIAMSGTAISMFIHRIGLGKYKTIIAGISLLLMLQGGGLATYIIRAEPNWYWQNNTIQNITQTVKPILKTITIGD